MKSRCECTKNIKRNFFFTKVQAKYANELNCKHSGYILAYIDNLEENDMQHFQIKSLFQ